MLVRLFSFAFTALLLTTAGQSQAQSVTGGAELGITCANESNLRSAIIEAGPIRGVSEVVLVEYWARPSVAGRAMVNCGDRPAVVISFLKRHGAAAAEARVLANGISASISEKYSVLASCEFRSEARRCAQSLEIVAAGLETLKKQGLELNVNEMHIYAPTIGGSRPTMPFIFDLGSLYSGRRASEINNASDVVAALTRMGALKASSAN